MHEYLQSFFAITLPVQPIPLARPRIGKGRTYTPARSANAKAIIATRIKSLYKNNPIDGPLGIKAIFVHKRPKKFGTGKRIPKSTRPDGDNLLKLVCDACEGILYHCDGQFTYYQVEDWYAASDETPKTILEFYKVNYEPV